MDKIRRACEKPFRRAWKIGMKGCAPLVMIARVREMQGLAGRRKTRRFTLHECRFSFRRRLGLPLFPYFAAAWVPACGWPAAGCPAGRSLKPQCWQNSTPGSVVCSHLGQYMVDPPFSYPHPVS
jgi:hypothetical protein